MTFSNLHPPPSSILRTIVLRNVYVLHPLAVHHFFSFPFTFLHPSLSFFSTILSSSFSTFHSFFYLLEEFSSLTKNVCVLSTHFFLSKKIGSTILSFKLHERIVSSSNLQVMLFFLLLVSQFGSRHFSVKQIKVNERKKEKASEEERREKKEKERYIDDQKMLSPLPLILHSDLLFKKKISSISSLLSLSSRSSNSLAQLSLLLRKLFHELASSLKKRLDFPFIILSLLSLPLSFFLIHSFSSVLSLSFFLPA